MARYALALTLGHNSSAIAIKDGKILGGYEEERFTKIKSDSQFPIKSITTLKERFNLPPDTAICISHWFLDGNIQPESKYFSTNKILELFPETIIVHLNKAFTHHDAHMKAAEVFAGQNFADDYHVFVLDGFGTAGECISIYEHKNFETKLINRVFGFNYSLGMFYQYATAFCGMKMHNHEYKMLAYETRINLIPNLNMDDVDDHISAFALSQISKIVSSKIDKKMDPMIDLGALVHTTEWVEKTLSDFLTVFNIDQNNVLFKRIMVSYFSQKYVEIMCKWLHMNYGPQNLILSGGVFYNVKLNSMLCDMTPGKTCVLPLAGDQGAGLGVYQYYFNDLEWPDHIFWGHRDFDYDSFIGVPNLMVIDEYDAMKAILKELETVGFVNIVRGAMEFGPRALCHTTTLGMPTLEVTEMINKMNNRTNEMPFALVMNDDQVHKYFKDPDKVHKSLEYMIMTREFKDNVSIPAGGAHFYPLTNTYTCRPQITNDKLISAICQLVGPIINTSWNYHGVPIVFDTDAVLYTHTEELRALPDVPFKTIIIREGN